MKMKKFLSLLMLIGIICFSTTTIVFGEEIVYDAYYIVTTPGEDASTQMNINYHTHNKLTSLEYTVASDINYENKTVVTGDLVEFEAKDDPTDVGKRVEEDFELRNIVSVYLTELEPGTEYRYRINKGDGTYTEDYTFRTADGGRETTFLFLTDAHVHKYSTQEATENTYHYDRVVVNRALEMAPNLAFVLHTGDMVDRGGKQSEWDTFFQASTNLRRIPMVGSPGNHEYYHYSTGEYSAKFYNAHFNSPKNGPAELLGSTSYFIYNNILFVQLDTVKRLNMQKQMDWFEEIVYNNPTKYIVVSAHKPFQGYAEEWFKLFEQFSVDLVLTGHTHSQNYRPNHLFTQNKKADDPNLGVTYLTGYGSGEKGANDGFGYLITIKDDKIDIQSYKGEQNLARFEHEAKRPDTHEPITKQEFIDSLTFTVDKENERAGLTWTEKAYGNVLKVEVKDNIRNYDNKQYIWTPSKTFIYFENIHDGYVYDYTATVTFADGTTESFNYVFDLDPNSNIRLTYEEETPSKAIVDVDLKDNLYHFTYFSVFLNDELFDEYNIFFDGFTKKFTFEDLDPNTEYTVRVEARTHRNEVIWTDELTFTTVDFKTTTDEGGCKSGTSLPYAILMGLSAVASTIFVVRRKKY